MGKSIRSKIKRKHRAEFRNTIGAQAFARQQSVIQDKLSTILVGSSTSSLEKLVSLTTTMMDTTSTTEDDPLVAPTELDAAPVVKEIRGENKAMPTKSSRLSNRRRKHSYRQKAEQQQQAHSKKKEKKRPRFFCQF